MGAIEPGTLVTDAGAPYGTPSWVGVVVRAYEYSHNPGPMVEIRQIGSRFFACRCASKVRPLSDAEAVGVMELLTRRWWTSRNGTDWDIGGTGPSAQLTANMNGEWMFMRDEHVEFGKSGSLEAAKASASRALVAYTCGWREKA